MDLGTTNLFLGILAVVSVLQLLGFLGAAYVWYRLYSRTYALVQGFEERQVAPAMTRVNAILDDVKEVSARVHEETERVDQAIRDTIDRVDETADRVRTTVQVRARRVAGLLHGVRVAIETFLTTDRRPHIGA
jgi:hypothetical protein